MGSPGRSIQSSIRQAQAGGDHSFFGFGRSQLRNRIDLIQAQLTGGETRPQDRQILKPTSHAHQLSRRGMSKAKPGRYPLDQIPSPVRQELLAQISIDQPLTDRSVKYRKPGEQIPQDLLHLIIGEPLPHHDSNVRTRCDRFGSKPGDQRGNLRFLERWVDPRSVPHAMPVPSRCTRHRPESRSRRGPWRRSSGRQRRERRRRCPGH